MRRKDTHFHAVHSFSYVDGSLRCEGIELNQIADDFGTPAYVYSAGTIRENYCRLDQALAPLDHLVCYAVKANSNIAVLNLLAKIGSGFDIVSGGELFRALKAGGDPKKIVFSGVGKKPQEIKAALDAGILMFNVESEEELTALNQIARQQHRIDIIGFNELIHRCSQGLVAINAITQY